MAAWFYSGAAEPMPCAISRPTAPEQTERAAEAVRGLVDDGPVRIVNTRLAQLTQEAEKAERRAAW